MYVNVLCLSILYIIAGLYEEECRYVCQRTRGTRKLGDASGDASWPLAEVVLAENQTVGTMMRREAEAKTMRRPEAEVAKEHTDA